MWIGDGVGGPVGIVIMLAAGAAAGALWAALAALPRPTSTPMRSYRP